MNIRTFLARTLLPLLCLALFPAALAGTARAADTGSRSIDPAGLTAQPNISDSVSAADNDPSTVFFILGGVLVLSVLLMRTSRSEKPASSLAVSDGPRVIHDPGTFSAFLDARKDYYSSPLELGAAFSQARLLPAAILDAVHTGVLAYSPDPGEILCPAADILPKQHGVLPDRSAFIASFIRDCCSRDKAQSISPDRIADILAKAPAFCTDTTDRLYRIILAEGKKYRKEIKPDAKPFRLNEAKTIRASLPVLCPDPPTGNTVLRSSFDHLIMLEYMALPVKHSGTGFDKLTGHAQAAYAAGKKFANCSMDELTCGTAKNGLPFYFVAHPYYADTSGRSDRCSLGCGGGGISSGGCGGGGGGGNSGCGGGGAD